jgi:hypothetical protein
LLTERDWLFLFGQTRQRVFSVHFWLRFAALWFAVVLLGFVVTLSCRLAWHRCLALFFSPGLLFGMLRRSGYVDEWANSPVAISLPES